MEFSSGDRGWWDGVGGNIWPIQLCKNYILHLWTILSRICAAKRYQMFHVVDKIYQEPCITFYEKCTNRKLCIHIRVGGLNFPSSLNG